jgi:hypothetical protein
MDLFATALTGGLAGSIFTLSIQGLLRWWSRPILSAAFKFDEPGCEVETPAYRKQGEKVVASYRHKYLRIKIKNCGRTFAKNVSVCVTKFVYSAPGSGETEFAEEVFDLRVGLGGGRTEFNLAPMGHRFVDLVHTEVCTQTLENYTSPPPQEGCQARRSFDFPSPLRLEDLGWTKGTYRFVVFVTAENAKSLVDKFQFSWDGSLEGLRIGPPL